MTGTAADGPVMSRSELESSAAARWRAAIRPLLDDERWARAAWSRVCEPADAQAARLVTEMGAVDALVALASPATQHHRVLRDRALDVDFSGLPSMARALGLRVLIPSDPDWPTGLDDLVDPPISLWVKGPGDLAGLQERSVAVVGSRAATAYGVGLSADISSELAARGYAVVSGAAYGIDRHAHVGALGASGATIGVLAGGLDRPYPAGNARLIARIGEVGAVVSEVCPGGAPTRGRFLKRNRLIATMTAGTLVVEANLRSGSLNTARTAAEYYRPVAAVPGPVVSPMSAGCHQLIRDGQATLVTDAAEMIELVGRLGLDAAPRRSAQPTLADAVEPADRSVLDVVPVRAGMPVPAIARCACVPETQARAALARLELLGLVVVDGDRWRKPIRRDRRLG